jgi:hypothetical protein
MVGWASIDPRAVGLTLWRQSHPTLARENEEATTPATD